MIKALSDKLERVQDSEISRGEKVVYGHLEDRIAKLVEKLDSSQGRLGHLEVIEREWRSCSFISKRCAVRARRRFRISCLRKTNCANQQEHTTDRGPCGELPFHSMSIFEKLGSERKSALGTADQPAGDEDQDAAHDYLEGCL